MNFVISQSWQQPLECVGEMPAEFRAYSSDYTKDVTFNRRESFIKKSNASVVELFQSGDVLFGDSVTNYVNKICSFIIAQNQLSFENVNAYVVRSAEHNAYATEQGQVFVTTGLIANSNSWQELAFVLSHELAHVKLRHNFSDFLFRKKIKYKESRGKDSIPDFNIKIKRYFGYSKKQELQADSLGMIYFLNAGLDRDQAISSIENLDLVNRFRKVEPWTPSYLETPFYRFPEMYYRDSVKAEQFDTTFFADFVKMNIDSFFIQDYEFSTHPDWELRKSRISKLNTQGIAPKKVNTSNFESSFEYITLRCRFDRIITHFQRSNYFQAHFLTNQLIQKTSASALLNTLRAVSLNNIYFAHYHKKPTNKTLPFSEKEGISEFVRMNRFFNILDQNEWAVLLYQTNQSHLVDQTNSFKSKYLKNSDLLFNSRYSSIMHTRDSILAKRDSTMEQDESRQSYMYQVVKNSSKTRLKYGNIKLTSKNVMDQTRSMYGQYKVPPTGRKNEDTDIKKSSIYFGKPKIHYVRMAFGKPKTRRKKRERLIHSLNKIQNQHSAKLRFNKTSGSSERTEISTLDWNKNVYYSNTINEILNYPNGFVLPITALFQSHHNLKDSKYYWYSEILAIDNGIPKSAIYRVFFPITFPITACKTLSNGFPETIMVSILYNNETNAIELIQYNTDMKNATDDYLRSQYYRNLSFLYSWIK